MINKSVNSSLAYASKYVVVSAACVGIAFLMWQNPKMALGLSVFLFLIPLFWILSEYINEEQLAIAFIFLFHLLPSLAGLRISESIPLFKATRIATLVVLFYLLRKGLLLQYYNKFFHANIFTKPILFVFLSYVLTAMLSYNKTSSLFFAISFFVEYLFLAVLVFSIFDNQSKIDTLIKVLCYSTLVICVFAIIEKITEFNFYYIFGVYSPDYVLAHQIRDGGIRTTGPFTHSIALGVYLAITMPLFFYRYKNRPLLMYALIMLLMFAIFTTQSRTAIICSILVISCYMIIFDRSKIPVVIILSIPFMVLFYEEIFSFFREVLPFTATATEQVESTNARLNQLDFLWQYIKENIVFGYGQVPPPAMVTAMNLTWTGVSNSIDNFYLIYIFFYGLAGLATWLILVIVILYKSFSYLARNKSGTVVSYIVLSIFAFLISNLVVALFENHYLFWIYIGIITRILYNERVGRQELVRQ